MITHDRWQQIKKVFHAAQNLNPAERPAFLNEACGNDPSIREEVDALLTADAGNDDDNFLSSPAYEFAAGMLASEATEFSVGQKVGRFEILCPLAAGGMGQIYLAYDAQLDRNIALKLISQEFATDPRRVHRFEQEARAASALNHPNVCVIHDIDVTESGRHFIAMEYIQGITLRDQLARGPLKPFEALQVVIQVGAALASAHAVGIVHRDIKPENIMLRPDGYVKVVDFGLAKLTEILPEQRQVDETDTKVRTEPRTLMGTVKYMSPEQLREASVDERTDIWSLGVVLYEMLTGTTPFEAKSRNDSIAVILGSQPVEMKFTAEILIQFQEIVKKALEKDRAKRYQTVSKLTADLNSLKRELERNADESFNSVYTPDIHAKKIRETEVSPSIITRLKSQAMLTADFLFSEIRTHKAAALFAGATSVFALLFFLSGFFNPKAPHPEVFPVTNAGTSVCTGISSDGKLIAHVEEQNGKQQLIVTNTTNFSSSPAITLEEGQYLGITFSRGGDYLYFTRKEKNGPGTLYQLAWPGNNPIQFKKGVDSPISFSPDGDRFAFVRHDPATAEYSLILSNVDGSNEQVIASRKDGQTLSIYGPAWSPDGSVVVCPTSYWGNGYHMALVGFDLKNGGEYQIGGSSWFSILQVAWQEDMSSMVVSARDRETSPHQLWRIRLPGGDAQKITSEQNEYRGVSIAGDKIVTVSMNLTWKIWVQSLDDPQKITWISSGVGLHYGLSWTRKEKIVFSSMAQDRLNIASIDPDGSHLFQLTKDGDNYTPASSPDGRFIVFSSNRNGAFNIWRINADDGSEPTQLTFNDGNFYPSCSSDNRWIAYDNLVKTISSVWKIPLEGGEPIKVGDKYRMPVFSPDDQFIACRYDLVSGSHDGVIFSAQDGQLLRHFPIPNQEWQQIQWFASSRQLSYVEDKDGYSNIWSYDLDTGTSKQLTNFNSDQIYAYAWSPDYKQVACQRGMRASDVKIIREK